MSDEIIAKLNARIGRRSFLRGSSLLAAAAGAALVLPGVARAQDPQASQAAGGQDGTAATDDKKGPEAKEPQDTKDAPPQQAKEGDGAETLIDSQGKPYRICPQCGANMYKQDRTWTCENCGYSYEE